MFYHSFMSGCIAGCVASFSVNPFDGKLVSLCFESTDITILNIYLFHSDKLSHTYSYNKTTEKSILYFKGSQVKISKF